MYNCLTNNHLTVLNVRSTYLISNYYEHWLKDFIMYFWLRALIESVFVLPTSSELPFLKLNTIFIFSSVFCLHINVVEWLRYYSHWAYELIMFHAYISRCLNWSEVVFFKKGYSYSNHYQFSLFIAQNSSLLFKLKFHTLIYVFGFQHNGLIPWE